MIFHVPKKNDCNAKYEYNSKFIDRKRTVKDVKLC